MQDDMASAGVDTVPVEKTRNRAKRKPDEKTASRPSRNATGDKRDAQPGKVTIAMPSPDNVYNFMEDDFASMMNRALLNPDVKYRLEPQSNRHRGLTPMLIALLMFIHKTARLADRRAQKFLGLTLVQYQTAFGKCGIANDTIRDNVRKLWKNFKFLEKKDYTVDKKLVTYYNINVKRFPCKDGIFLFGEEGDRAGSRFWAIHCPEYPFCSCMPKDCLFIDDIEALVSVLQSGFLAVLKKRLETWREESKAVKGIQDGLLEILRCDTDKEDYFSDFTPSESLYFATKLYKARLKDKEKGTFDDDGEDDRGDGKKSHYDRVIDDIRKDVIDLYEEERRKSPKKPVKLPAAKGKALDYIP
jgi:hypothetical protein